MLLGVSSALAINGTLTVGVTSDEYVLNKKHPVRLCIDRKADIFDYLLKIIKPYNLKMIDIVSINGNIPTKKDTEDITQWDNLDILVVSEETYQGALEFNKERSKIGLLPLKIVVIPVLLADDGIRISSTRIHNNEIDLNGKTQTDTNHS